MFNIEMPDFIGGEQIICYTVVDLSSPTGNTQHFVNGKLQSAAYGLAICKLELEPGYYLFYCDNNWTEFADTWHETIDDTKDQAEYEYAGITNFWKYK